MASHMYIAGSFRSVVRTKCGEGGEWIDNDPHFWNKPPTWGICRPDLRERTGKGEYVFFVLPKASKLPQTIFGYMRIKKIIPHEEAFSKSGLRAKRMINKKPPNGNIIVNDKGSYNRFDGGAHKNGFERIRKRYAIGDTNDFRFLKEGEIIKSAPYFLSLLQAITGKQAGRPIDMISRYGLQLNKTQVDKIKAWLYEKC